MLSRLSISREAFEEVMRKRMFFTPAFEIYGGSSGLYDYGPPGCGMMINLLSLWRSHFIVEDGLLEIETTCVTPAPILETSGHVARFQDYMVRDISTNAFYRADHLLEEHMSKLLQQSDLSFEQIQEYTLVKTRVDDYNQDELAAALLKYNVRSPTGSEITSPFPFNLMFSTSIGPSQTTLGYLRPETAQGIFVNFNKLLEYNGGKIPFGAATIGRAFRNEISPRQGLLRVREFTLAEIEYFVHPKNKDHPRFDEVKNTILNLFSRDAQLNGSNYVEMKIGDAVNAGIVNNQTLGYYLVRCHSFLLRIGIKPEWVRFRQHLTNEMAHYASDCWDAELLTTYGWIECIGNADRACYDLSVHSKATGSRLAFWESYSEPKMETRLIVRPNKSNIGRKYKQYASTIFEVLNQLTPEQIQNLQQTFILNIHGMDVRLDEKDIIFETISESVHGHYITPSVIEPSFGMGRILYALLEQSFYQRPEDLERGVLELNSLIAPIKCAIFPLMVKSEFLPYVKNISRMLLSAGITSKLDCSSGSIGKHYAKADEIGIPFAITVDHQTLNDNTVTLRYRDSKVQIRIRIEEIIPLLSK